MRLFSGLFGVALVPMTFLTMKNLKMSESTAVLTAAMILFENALTWYFVLAKSHMQSIAIDFVGFLLDWIHRTLGLDVV